MSGKVMMDVYASDDSGRKGSERDMKLSRISVEHIDDTDAHFVVVFTVAVGQVPTATMQLTKEEAETLSFLLGR